MIINPGILTNFEQHPNTQRLSTASLGKCKNIFFLKNLAWNLLVML